MRLNSFQETKTVIWQKNPILLLINIEAGTKILRSNWIILSVLFLDFLCFYLRFLFFDLVTNVKVGTKITENRIEICSKLLIFPKMLVSAKYINTDRDEIVMNGVKHNSSLAN